MPQREVQERRGVLVSAADSQCRRAYDRLLQGLFMSSAIIHILLTICSAQSVQRNGENEPCLSASHLRSLEASACAAIYPCFAYNNYICIYNNTSPWPHSFTSFYFLPQETSTPYHTVPLHVR